MSLRSRAFGPRSTANNPGLPTSRIDVSFTYPTTAKQVDAVPPPPSPTAAAAVSPPPPPPSIPTSTEPIGLRAWAPESDSFIQVTDEPSSVLPIDGILYDKRVDPDTKEVSYVPHVALDAEPSAAYGREYAKMEIQRQLEIEQSGIYRFMKLLNGAIYNKAATTSTLGGLWTSGSPGEFAVRTIFTNFLSGSSAGAGATGSVLDPSKVIEPIQKRLYEGLEDSVGSNAAAVNGWKDESSRSLAANIAVGTTQHRALDFAERAIKIANSAKDLPEDRVGSIVRDVLGIGGGALSNPAVGVAATAAPPPGGMRVNLATDLPPPPSVAKGSTPTLPVVPTSPRTPATTPPSPPTGAVAVPSDPANKDLVGKTPSEVALALAKRQIVNADYQLYQILKDNPTEAKLRAWDLLYFDGTRYIRPKSLTTVVKDLEAARTIEKILGGVSNAASRGTPMTSAVAHYRSVENTGMLFIDDTVAFAMRRAYDYIRYTHGQQSIPMVSYMTQANVNARFAELVAIMYHKPPGASQPRGATAYSVAESDQDLYLLGQWLSNCKMVGLTVHAPGMDMYATEVRKRREMEIDRHVQLSGDYPTSDSSYYLPKRYRSVAEERRAKANRKAIEAALGFVLGK